MHDILLSVQKAFCMSSSIIDMSQNLLKGNNGTVLKSDSSLLFRGFK